MTRRNVLPRALALAATLLLSATAQAQAFRTYLAPTGSDANPCSLSAPCRLLPAALAAVAAGGEIWILGSANYNTAQVDITKSVTILAVPGALGSVVAAGGNAISIATPGVKVALRNLVIVPLPGGGGTGGINMTNGAGLTVENCLIANLPSAAIWVNTAAAVRIADTTIRDNAFYNLYFQNGARATVTRSTISGASDLGVLVSGSVAGTTTTADLGDSTIEGSVNGGLTAASSDATAVVKVSVHDSRVVRNGGFGMAALGNAAGASATLSASNNIVSDNGHGIGAFEAGSKVWASGNTVSNNGGVGVQNTAGVFESTGNNAVRNNGTDKIGTVLVVTME